MRVLKFALSALVAFSFCQVARAELAEFYLGVDKLANIASGLYGGLPNPNYNRLTLLYNHGNHYHGLGTHSYSGPNLGAGTLVNDTNGNNRVPEISSGAAPLLLTAGSGLYAGKLVSSALPGVEYSDLELQNVHSLNGNPEDTQGLFNSSSGRWNGPLWDTGSSTHAHIHLELVSATPGLNVGSLTDLNALSVGGDTHVGDGDEFFAFAPVLWTDANAPVGTYTAEFRLTDENNLFGDSGRFFVDVRVVPEPSSLALAGLGGLFFVGMIRQRRTLRNA